MYLVWGRKVDGDLYPRPRKQPFLGAHSILKASIGDEHVAVVTATAILLPVSLESEAATESIMTSSAES